MFASTISRSSSPRLFPLLAAVGARTDRIEIGTGVIDMRQRTGAQAPDYFQAVLRYPDKRVVLHASKLVAANTLRFAVHGTRGSWIKHGVDPQEAATVSGRVPGGEDWGVDPQDGTLTLGGTELNATPWPNQRGDYRLFWNALAAAVRGEAPNPVPPSEALLVMEVLDAGLRSASQRAEIAL